MSAKLIACLECGAPTNATVRDVQYPESGVPHAVIVAATVRTCANGHEEVEVADPAGLSRRLAESIVMKPGALNGPELRFLRKELGRSARAFSTLIGITDVHLSRLENGRTRIGQTLDRMVRLLYVRLFEEQSQSRFPQVLAEFLATLDLESKQEYEHELSLVQTGTAETDTEWRAHHRVSLAERPTAVTDICSATVWEFKSAMAAIEPFSSFRGVSALTLHRHRASRLLDLYRDAFAEHKFVVRHSPFAEDEPVALDEWSTAQPVKGAKRGT